MADAIIRADATLSAISRTSNVVSVTLTANFPNSNLKVGQEIVIDTGSGGTASFNGKFTIATVTDQQNFTYAQTDSNETGTLGTGPRAGGTYTDWDDWGTNAPTSISAPYVVEMYDDWASGCPAHGVDINGWSGNSATNTITLRSASGEFTGDGWKSGAFISNSTSAAPYYVFQISEQYVILEDLEIEDDQAYWTIKPFASNFTMRNVLVDRTSGSNTYGVFSSSTNTGTVECCLFRSSGAVVLQVDYRGAITFYNVGVIQTHATNALLTCAPVSASLGSTIENSYFYGDTLFATAFSAEPNVAYNRFKSGIDETFGANATADMDTGSFVNYASADYTPANGQELDGNGTTLNVSTDLQGASYVTDDIGPLIASTTGGGTTINANTEALTLTEYAATVALDVDVAATTESLALTTFSATVALDVDISAAAESLTLTAHQATVDLSSDEITITTEPANNTFYQRDMPSGDHDVTVGGVVTGTATNIELSYDDGATWPITLTGPFTDQSYSTTEKVPAGGARKWRARFSNSPAVQAIGANTWYVGIQVDIKGQSNALRMTTIGTDLSAQALGLQWNNSTNVWEAFTTTGNWRNSFVSELASEGIAIGITQSAVNATKVIPTSGNDTWRDYDTASTPYWFYTTEKGQQPASEAEISIWFLGESDGWDAGTTAANMESALDDFFTRLRTDITNKSGRAALPVLFGVLGNTTGGPYAGWLEARKGQQDFVAGASEVYDFAYYDLALADNVHLAAASFTTLGQRMAQWVKYHLGSQSEWSGPRIQAAQLVDSTTIDVTIAHGAGTDFSLVTGSPEVTLFEVLQTGSPGTVPISSVTRQDATTVRLALASPVSGATQIQYAWNENAGSEGWLIDNATVAQPLIPQQPLDVTTDVAATTESLVLTTYPATVALDVTISAGTEALALTTYQAAVAVGQDIQAATEALVLTAFPATVALDVTITATTEVLGVTTYRATIQSSGTALTVPGLEYTLSADRLHYTLSGK